MKYIKLNIQRFGGRGAKSPLKSMKISKKELIKRKIEYAKKTGNYNYLPSGYGVLNGKIVKIK